jgi:hypothetical protein
MRDGLFHALVEDAEILLFETGDRAIHRVVDGCRNQHEVGVHAQVGPRIRRRRGRGLLSGFDGDLAAGDAHQEG